MWITTEGKSRGEVRGEIGVNGTVADAFAKIARGKWYGMLHNACFIKKVHF